MSIFKNIYSYLFAVFILISTANAATPIQIEVKNFGEDIVFVFYHSNDQVVDLHVDNNKVKANINLPANYHLLNQEKFDYYAINLNQDYNNQQISFDVLEDYEFQNIINGEKLEAIKFKRIIVEDEIKPNKIDKDYLNKTDYVKVGVFDDISASKNDLREINYKSINNKHVLSFDVSPEDANMAVFFRGNYLWFVFDKQKIFTFEDRGIFSNFMAVESDVGTVFKLQVPIEYQKAFTRIVDNKWEVEVQKYTQDKLPKGDLSLRRIEEEKSYYIKGEFSDKLMITFEDNVIGDILKIVPMSNQLERVDKQRNSIEYSILETIQGVVIALYNDDVSISMRNKHIKIVADTKLPDLPDLKAKDFFVIGTDYSRYLTLLPVLDQKLDILDFVEQRSRLMNYITKAKNQTQKYKRLLKLAKVLFISKFYKESLDAIYLARDNAPEQFKKDLIAKFMSSVCHTMMNEFTEAKIIYNELLSYQDVYNIKEVHLWNNYNNFLLDENNDYIGVIENATPRMELYSDDKYWPLIFAEIELALTAGDTQIVDKLLRGTRKPPQGNFANSLGFYRALFFDNQGKRDVANKFYENLINQDEDVYNYVRAKYKLEKNKYLDKEITIEQFIQTLEILRFMWRGDKLEYDILMKLADLYLESNNTIMSLRTYKYVHSAFKNKVSNFYLSSEMSRLFNSIFLKKESLDSLEDFKLVALFYEFKELNPIGKKGDDVILEVARRMVKLDLFDSASELLKHQISYRLRGKKRVDNANILALVYIMDKKPMEAIKIIDQTDRDNYSYQSHLYRLRLRTQSLMQLGRYEEAIKYLQHDTSNDAITLKLELLFQMKDWQGYLEELTPKLDDLIDNLIKDKANKQDLLRFAISHYMMGNYSELKEISKSVGTKDESLKSTIDLMLSNSGTIDYNDLDQSLNIDQMKSLLDKYKNQFVNQDK